MFECKCDSTPGQFTGAEHDLHGSLRSTGARSQKAGGRLLWEGTCARSFCVLAAQKQMKDGSEEAGAEPGPSLTTRRSLRSRTSSVKVERTDFSTADEVDDAMEEDHASPALGMHLD